MAYFPRKQWDTGAEKWEKTVRNPDFPHYFYYFEADLFIDDILVNTKLALELGCGTGGSTIRHASPELRIVGVDYSPGMLKMAREKLRQSGKMQNADLVCGDACHLPLRSEVFDAAFSRGVAICYVTEPDEFAREAFRVLKPKGKLGIDFMNRIMARKSKRIGRYFDRIDGVLYYIEQFNENGKQKRVGYRIPPDTRLPESFKEGSMISQVESRPDWLDLKGLQQDQWWAIFLTPRETRQLLGSAGFRRVRFFPLGCFTYGMRGKPDLWKFLKENRDMISRLQKELHRIFRLEAAVHIFATASKT